MRHVPFNPHEINSQINEQVCIAKSVMILNGDFVSSQGESFKVLSRFFGSTINPGH